MRNEPRLIAALLAALVLSAPAGAERTEGGLAAVFPASVRNEPASGRLAVYLVREGAAAPPRFQPGDGPWYDDPQPVGSVGVEGLAPGAEVRFRIDRHAFPAPFDDLPAGAYRARAVLDMHEDDGDWRREPGNLYSEVLTVEKRDGEPLSARFVLSNVVRQQPPPEGTRAVVFEVRSDLLSAFHGRERRLRAGVLLPEGLGEGERVPTVYIVPGFGGDHRMIYGIEGGARRRWAEMPTVRERIAHIVLDPSSGNGHTLFADSANNGPVGRALVEELIPALERAFPLLPTPPARAVYGHSSGGWSALWLTLSHPGVFGHCFSGAPDPVDFRAFQKVNIYERTSMYTDELGQEIASNLKGGRVLMTIRQENQWEEALGPRGSSGQQWHSWQAVFGSRAPDGGPAPLFDPATGLIDRDEAERYRRFDIAERLRREPERLLPLFRERIRIVVGAEDEWNLGVAVAMLRDELAARGATMDGAPGAGLIRIVPGANHGSVMATQAYREMLEEMARVLTGAGRAASAAE